MQALDGLLHAAPGLLLTPVPSRSCRIPELQHELSVATEDDVTAGWVDAFQVELNVLQASVGMVKEDVRAEDV